VDAVGTSGGSGVTYTYDPESDSHYFWMVPPYEIDQIVKTVDLGDRQVHLDYDAHGNLVGVEVL
jgi:YD repeat-containing protein